MTHSSLDDVADRAVFALLWFDHARGERDCDAMRRALDSLAGCMQDMGDAASADELRALAERHRRHGGGPSAGQALHPRRRPRAR
ncbi:hypothetical protein LG634_21915 [Streptomyces bambusae]|uniref:hypothetical protein n=1 Tax=Streptomyces bambusae TaxID=1550616 RepID=UPI001CFD6298|nr:hypothetical protein [Streptomyces bambusae]MCB5167473.1 hypothetical protein [Streptomyces bambusae]